MVFISSEIEFGKHVTCTSADSKRVRGYGFLSVRQRKINNKSSKKIYKERQAERIIKWMAGVVVLSFGVLAFFKTLSPQVVILICVFASLSFYYFYQNRCLIIVNLNSNDISIRDGFFPWSESYLLKPKTINTIVLAYDTLDKDQASVYEKAEEIDSILGKPLKDYSDVENMTYYNESVFLV